MKKIVNKKKTFWARKLSLVLSLAIGGHLPLAAYKQEVIDRLAQDYCRNFSSLEKPADETKKPNGANRVFSFFKPKDLSALNQPLDTPTKNKLSVQAAPPKAASYASVLDYETTDKLSLVSGPDYLVRRLFGAYLYTTNGALAAATLLSQPTTDIGIIGNRQAIIQELTNNPKLLNECKKLLQEIKKYEPSFLELFAQENPLVTSLLKKPYYPESMSLLNDNRIALAAKKIFWNTLPFVPISTIPALFCLTLWGRYQQDKAGYARNPAEYPAPPSLGQSFNAITEKISKAVKEHANNPEKDYGRMLSNAILGVGPIAGLIGLATTVSALGAIDRAKITRIIQEKSSNIFSYFAGIEQLQTLIAANKTTAGKLNLPNKSTKNSDQYKTLLEWIKSHKPGAKLSGPTALASYTMLQKVKHEFAPILRAVGELETLVAAAQLIKNQQKSGGQFCFVDLLNQSTPEVVGLNFWNPLLDPAKTVTNDIFFNHDLRSMILTGPNAGGKTTYATAIMLNLILGQTLGIAAAQSFSFTLFSKLLCYLSVTEDRSKGLSTFAAQALRANELEDALRALKSNEKAFFVIDELFSGTDSAQAEEEGFEIIKLFAQDPRCCLINATHFNKIKTLPEEIASCKNYQVEAIIKKDNQGRDIVERFTFKVIPGISAVRNAHDLLNKRRRTAEAA